MIATETRNAELSDLVGLLEDQHERKVDVVAPASKIRSEGGLLRIEGTEPVITDDGVTQGDGLYRPTRVCDEGIAQKIGIPLPYLKRLREERADMFDANVNGWLQGRREKVRQRSNPAFREYVSNVPPAERDAGEAPPQWLEETIADAVPGDPRSFLIRAFRGDDGEAGVARAFLSDKYKVVDNLDVLTAALDGVRQAGTPIVIDGCDLTDRRMYVRVIAPQMTVLAENLLKNYRNPFGDDFERWRRVADREGLGFGDGSEPIVFAGFVISNSETGGGAFTITPRMVIKVCKNGLTLTKDALRGVHLGSQHDEGVIRWSDDTQQKTLALVTAKARDAVATFLDTDYMSKAIGEIEEKAGVPVVDPTKQIEIIGKALQFSTEARKGVLEHFIRGADTTAGGLMNAVTSYAQTIPNADEASDLEGAALRVLDMAAANR